jgi:biotin carboxylase
MNTQAKNENVSVLVIEPMGAGGELLLQTIRCLGYRSVVATTREVYNSILKKHSELIDDVLFVDFSDTQAATELLVNQAPNFGVSGVVVAWEFLTDIAAEVAARLNMCGPEATLAKARRNKLTMYRTLENAHCPIPTLQAVITPDRDCTQLLYEELDYPLIVKPAENSASFGVTVVSSGEDIQQAIKDAGQWTHESPHGIPFSREILIQEYIPGQEFSVEALSVSGRYLPWGVTMKFTTEGKARAETAHIFPAPIPALLRDKILQAAEQTAVALGITNGISHTEIKLDKKGNPRIIESCSRPAGDYIPRLVELATGENPIGMYVKQSIGELGFDFVPAKPFRYAAIQFLRPVTEGRIRWIDMPKALRRAEMVDSRVTVAENAYVSPGSTNIERLGWAIFVAQKSEDIVAAMDEFNYGTRIYIK